MSEENKTHPLRIGSTYAGQFRRADDAVREREEAERIQALRDYEPLEPAAHPVALYNEAWAEELEQYTPPEAEGRDGEQTVNRLIAQKVADASAYVAEANLDPQERLAKLIAKEIKSQDDEPDPDSPEWFARQAAEESRLLAELEEEEDEPPAIDAEEDIYIGVDELGRDVYQGSDGSQYVLVDEA